MPLEQVKFTEKLLENVSEAVLSEKGVAACENCYVNDVGGLTRFPFPMTYQEIPFNQPVYLYHKDFRGDLHGVASGHAFRFSDDSAEDLTKFVIAGGKRVVFAETTEELLMVAGGKIGKLKGEETRLLSATAPESTHIGYIDGYLVAATEFGFRHSPVGDVDGEWDELDTFSAEGQPDDVIALQVTDFNELLLGGPDSLEQFTAANGTPPFVRQYTSGPGVFEDAPYTMTFADNRTWYVNSELDFIATTSQLGSVESGAIRASLKRIDNWNGAFTTKINTEEKTFMLLCAPMATNRYGTTGITMLYDLTGRRWLSLYGWDKALGRPTRFDCYSVSHIRGQTYIGGTGKVYKLGRTADSGTIQRMLWRSGHITMPGMDQFSVEEVIVRAKRGVGGKAGEVAPLIGLRANKNNRGFGRMIRKSLGLVGDKEQKIRFPKIGNCESVQFELEVTDNVDVEIVKMDMRLP